MMRLFLVLWLAAAATVTVVHAFVIKVPASRCCSCCGRIRTQTAGAPLLCYDAATRRPSITTLRLTPQPKRQRSSFFCNTNNPFVLYASPSKEDVSDDTSSAVQVSPSSATSSSSDIQQQQQDSWISFFLREGSSLLAEGSNWTSSLLQEGSNWTSSILQEGSNWTATTLAPLDTLLNETTNGWALTYADLTPETETTPAGISFLATNLAYGLAGGWCFSQGDFVYGFVMELAGIFSFVYHFSQLKLGPDQSAVRLALLLDYIFAGVAIATTAAYLVTMEGGWERLPYDGLAVGAVSVVFLCLSWVWEVGYPYLFFHSIWHLLGACSGYLIGQAHLK